MFDAFGSWYLNMALLARASGNTFQFSNNCFYKFSLNFIKLKLQSKYPSGISPCIQGSSNTRLLKTDARSVANEKITKYVVFDNLMSLRRDQARRSILVQVQSEQSSFELCDYCSQFGKIQEMHHYAINGSVHFVLIEFNSLSDMNSISSAFTHTNVHQNLPVVSPMLWFRATNNKKKGSFSTDIPMKIINGKAFPSSQTVSDWLFSAESISDQMKVLCNSTQLNDTDTRLRFITARQIETCLSGMFSDISVLPFGSSVNGFGKHGCDLDLVLKLQNDDQEDVKGRLVYHTKSGGSNDRAQAQKIMETISDIMQQFLPGITGIRRILRARVPIIKYNQTLTGLECDLSMTNTTGIHMSELLYLYGELDWRVKPLVFTIKMWANCVHLTNNSPGNWITNFSLTLLTLFYLQQKQILPSLQQLVKLANKNDIRIADGCVDCTFLRDISRLPKSSSKNQESLEELLTNFFIYYSSFDFLTKAISLNVGTPIPKPDASVIFIYNPLEQGLNVAKNMNIQETERLKVEMRNAAWSLDSVTENKSAEWGLLSLFQQKVHQNEKTSSSPSANRMLEVSTLFKKQTAVENLSKNSENTQDTSNIAASNNKSNSVNKNTDRQGGGSNIKTRTSRRLEWRR